MRDEISVKIYINEETTFLVKKCQKMPKTVPHVLPRSATWGQKSSILKKVFKNLWAGASFEMPWSITAPKMSKWQPSKVLDLYRGAAPVRSTGPVRYRSGRSRTSRTSTKSLANRAYSRGTRPCLSFKWAPVANAPYARNSICYRNPTSTPATSPR